jgi:hypothetical protein
MSLVESGALSLRERDFLSRRGRDFLFFRHAASRLGNKESLAGSGSGRFFWSVERPSAALGDLPAGELGFRAKFDRLHEVMGDRIERRHDAALAKAADGKLH